MKFCRDNGKRFLALILTAFLIGGMYFVPGVFAEENNFEVDGDALEVQEKTDINENKDVVENTNIAEMEESTDGNNNIVDVSEVDTNEQEIENNENSLVKNQSEEEGQIQTDEETEQLYSMEVTFDEKKLDVDENKNTEFNWKDTSAKSLTITLNRNRNVEVDAAKYYVICIKVPETFYFSGLSSAADINGVEEVGFVKNVCPRVNNSVGQNIELPNFSPYSGEMRLRVNPSVDIITIPNVGINYNKELIGYTGGSQSVSNPVAVSLVAVENTKSLNSFAEEDKTEITNYKVASINIATSSLSGSNMKNYMSTDGFTTAGITEQDVQLGKNNEQDTISYAGGTAGQKYQYYKTLIVEFSCPYIEVNNQKYYLNFDPNDSVLQTNQQGVYKGFRMSKNAEYNASAHTITYTFAGIYIGEHTPLFYSPKFSWPQEEIKDLETASESYYVVQGADWKIKEQTCYTGATATLRDSYTPTKYANYYIVDGVNITLVSSDEAPQEEKIAKRQIYKEITRENKIEGALGFFDIHNKGTIDSPKVQVMFEFNTNESDQATYYITKVNLPVYGNDEDVNVAYCLTNGNDTKEGVKHYEKKSSFSCSVTDLREESKVDDTYYIKRISYTTELERGTAYHLETAHLWRNRENDSGLYFGYLEGAVGTVAHATMSIQGVDENTVLNGDNDKRLSSTEKSTVADKNYIAFKLTGMQIANGASTAITAGDSTTLTFNVNISNEEYYDSSTETDNKSVNGYHVFENGIFYICLPEDVSIAGTDQVRVQSSGRQIAVQSVKKIGDSCTVNNLKAQWWEIQANDIRQSGGKIFAVEVQLATNLQMNSLSWDFQNCVVVRANNQRISWGAAGDNTICNTTKEMSGKLSTSAIIKALSSYLDKQNDSENLGMSVYSNANAKMTITRAEAKLDVETGIKMGTVSMDRSDVRISDVDTPLTYDVTVSSEDGGHAENFEYYIPIVSTNSVLDVNTLVAQNDFGLTLQQAVTIEKNGVDTTENMPFEVYYTKELNLTGANIRGNNVAWNKVDEMGNDFSSVSAVKIVTKQNTIINNGESYKFSIILKYSGGEDEFNKDAGRAVQWRSFGHYTYVRNNASTTATYPSQINRVIVCYKKNLTENPMNIVLETNADKNVKNGEMILKETFKNDQTFVVKKVETNGVQLIKTDPIKLTGTNANTQFNIAFNINNISGAAAQLSDNGTDAGKQWTVTKNSDIKLQTEVKFSKALTDQVTPRYIDVTIGNDNVDITFRIQLNRVVKPATAIGSGVTNGANYQVPNIEEQCSIAKNSAFTALYVLDFVPGNYKTQMISWKNSNSKSDCFPEKTKITMMEIADNSAVNSFWYYKTGSNESAIDLSKFKRMGGSENYSYDTSTASARKIKYMFVVDFSEASENTGIYQFNWEAVAKDENSTSASKLSYPYSVTLTSEKTYQLRSNDSIEGGTPQVTISYVVGEAENDSYIAHRSLSLVIKPEDSSSLPKDAKLSCGEKEYSINKKGNYIVPIENIASGEKTISLISDMFPDEEKTYSFTAQLYLSESTENTSPINGKSVGESIDIKLTKTVQNTSSLSVTGKRIGTVSEWSEGQDISIQMKNIEDGNVTVTAYSGTTGTQQVTNLLSSVSGMFDIQSGVGIYKKSNTDTKLLKLSSNAQPGTYRLIFDVKNNEDIVVMQIPYYIIVK